MATSKQCKNHDIKMKKENRTSRCSTNETTQEQEKLYFYLLGIKTPGHDRVTQDMTYININKICVCLFVCLFVCVCVCVSVCV